jgi:two-component system, sensor histidine kinase ChiS
MEQKSPSTAQDIAWSSQELTTLYELSAAIIQSINVTQFLQSLLERVGKILQVRSGSIVMPDGEGFLRAKAYFGLKEENIREYVQRPGEGRAGRIFLLKKAQNFVTSQERSSSSTPTFHQITIKENIEHSVGAPMIASNGECLGVLFFNDKLSKVPFTEREFKLLESFANLAAIGIEKHAQLEELNHQKERYRELSEKLEASIQDLHTLNEQLRESNKLKDEVLSICAHDVRSPLTSITSYAELLLAGQNLTEKQRRYLGHIHRSSKKIDDLVQNLLVRMRFIEKQEPIYYESLNLGMLVQEAVRQIEDRLVNRQLQVTLKDNWQQRIRADRFKIAQVIDNLLENAVKFTAEGGEIKIEIAETHQPEYGAKVTVSNPGEGIPSEALPKIFARYFQVENKISASGYGLGLAICKKNIDMHGGTINVQSVPNEYTSFQFTLPWQDHYLIIVTSDLDFIRQQIDTLNPIGQWRYEIVSSVEELLNCLRIEVASAIIIDRYLSAEVYQTLIEHVRRDYDPMRLPIWIIGGAKITRPLLEAEYISSLEPNVLKQLLKL